MTCLFCDIVSKKIPVNVVYESHDVLAFYDIAPQAPQHVLIIPKLHINDILAFQTKDVTLWNNLLAAIHEVCQRIDPHHSGFRVVTNTGLNGGQTVNHLHFHILSGRQLSWPPG
jgi:histidine triad (HIT) family protein